MRSSADSQWYKIDEALDGLQGTSKLAVRAELLRHLGSKHIQRFKQDGCVLTACFDDRADLEWTFSSASSLDRFVVIVSDWFRSQKVAVPTLGADA